MLTSISPLGERARHNRWAWTVSWYVAASAIVGAAVGLALGAVGGLLGLVVNPTARAIAFAVIAVVAVLVDVGRVPLRSWRRQVNEDWLQRYRGWVYGAGFGAQLGAGVATIVTTAAVYLTLVAEVLAGSALAGLAIGATFGVVRALPLLSVSRTTTFDDLTSRHRRLMTLASPMRRATVTVMSFGAVAGVALAISGAR